MSGIGHKFLLAKLSKTHTAKEIKAFPFFDRGRPFKHIQAAAISRYTAGEFRNNDR